jgi:hypothetical protein
VFSFKIELTQIKLLLFRFKPFILNKDSKLRKNEESLAGAEPLLRLSLFHLLPYTIKVFLLSISNSLKNPPNPSHSHSLYTIK